MDALIWKVTCARCTRSAHMPDLWEACIWAQRHGTTAAPLAPVCPGSAAIVDRVLAAGDVTISLAARQHSMWEWDPRSDEEIIEDEVAETIAERWIT